MQGLKKAFNIAIDITSVPEKPTGIGVYIIELTQNLITVAKSSQHQFYIIGRSDQKSLFNHNLYISNYLPSKLKRIIWEQISLPLIIKKYNINILHSPNYTLPIFGKCRRISTIFDLTCFIYPERRPFFHGLYFRIMMKITSCFASQIITISNNTKTDMEKFLGTSCTVKTKVIYPGYSNLFTRPDTTTIKKCLDKFKVNSQYFLFVSTLEPSKNVPRLLEAFSKYLKKHADHQLLLVGKTGWGIEEIDESIKQLNLTTSVKKIGYCSVSDLCCLYSGSIAFIYPSLYEGFGIPPLEAMACGAPVGCSNSSSLPEVVSDSALTFDPYSPEEIFTTLCAFTESPNLRETYIKKGYERVSNFSWLENAKKTWNVYCSDFEDNFKVNTLTHD